MYAIATINAVVEKQLPGTHPLWNLRAKMRESLRALTKAAPEVSPRASGQVAAMNPHEILPIMLWQGVMSFNTDEILRLSLRFNIVAQWFVGFVIDDLDWKHVDLSVAIDNFREDPRTVQFFGTMTRYIREHGLHRRNVPELSPDVERLNAWASANVLIPSAETDPTRGHQKPSTVRDWQSFGGEKRRTVNDWVVPAKGVTATQAVAYQFAKTGDAVQTRSSHEASQWHHLSQRVRSNRPLDEKLKTARALLNAQMGAPGNQIARVLGTSKDPSKRPEPPHASLSTLEKMYDDIMSK